ncbi:hypothetical protein Afil01_44110 [Actinorhabdospora filicis]|uniref:HTH cro/C1-type domain-containing protein n=1 Tax=Actinorhabdospora filicis TaxID=1785913 RepID=A0A9W6SME3_9ACTN|nr:helix-turn-helix transcriptional regulator [Actinorhabdospora filicis]GLZ79604.1 hypothetical protein Afil01_44110 [Actinorhabdospora filicis]
MEGYEWVALPETRTALARGDWATVLHLYIRATGATQTQIAEATGLTQPVISRIAGGKRRPTHLETIRALCHGLGVPPQLAGLADTDEGPETKRRAFLATAATVAFAGSLAPYDGLPDVEQLAAPVLAYRRAEAHTAARLLRPPVTAHLTMLRQLAGIAEKQYGPTTTARLYTLVSEAAGFAGWLASDTDDRAEARRSYQLAVHAAERAGHELLVCYMRVSLAQYAATQGETRIATSLIDQARQALPAHTPPIVMAWLECIEATVLATARYETALRLLDDAANRLDDAEPVWPWLVPIDTNKINGYRDLVDVRLRRRLGDVGDLPHPATATAPKQAALAVAERAAALADLGDHDTAARLGIAVWDTAYRYGSEKLLTAVADVRARIPLGAHGDPITALDARLTSVYQE